MSESVAKRRAEFEKHVWDHADDAFQQSFDLRAPLEPAHSKILLMAVDSISRGDEDSAISDLMASAFKSDLNALYAVLQLVGLTRNKPKSDLTAPLTAKGVRVPSRIEGFVSRPDAWAMAGPYLAKRLRTVLTPLVGMPEEFIPGVLETLNQATWPGYVRQERAKRSGGYAEQRIAIMLRQLGIPFVPEGKADDGLTSDAHFAGESFDIIIPTEEEPTICIICMAHSSNIGQYGESKADDTRRAKKAVGSTAAAPILMAFADGVGFHGNSAGLDKILAEADEFFQFETLWKCAVVAASSLGLDLELVLPDPEGHQEFLDHYAAAVRLVADADAAAGWTEAGEGLVRLAT